MLNLLLSHFTPKIAILIPLIICLLSLILFCVFSKLKGYCEPEDSGKRLIFTILLICSVIFAIYCFYISCKTFLTYCYLKPEELFNDAAKEATTTTEIVSEETVSNEITAEESSIEETIVEETQEITKSAEEDPVIIKYQRYAYTEYLNDMEPGDLLDLDIADRSKLLVGTDTETAETFWNTETSEYKDFYEIYYSELER